VTFNSATTALHGAIVALEIGPGDEVIVPPYSMAASATCVLQNGAVPIFADIDERTFCISPESIKSRITKYTKAIVVVDLFGQAAALDEIMAIAKEHNLKVIEDNAQSPNATYKGKLVGTIADIGIFSLNVNKIVQAGEGGILVTNNDRYAHRAQLLRNHGESVVDALPDYQDGPIFGSNYRMTEIEAAISYEQILKLPFLTEKRLQLCEHLTKRLTELNIDGITLPYIPPENTHVYFHYPLKIDEQKLGVSRDVMAKALNAEGFQMSAGYVKPIYLLRVFQERKAFNETNFPFEYPGYDGKPNYDKGLCPVVERMFEKELLSTQLCQYPRTLKHVDQYVEAIQKVLAHKDELQAVS
jgi:dTDP-4-amino-4,6-dideoxygalactose transaminase